MIDAWFKFGKGHFIAEVDGLVATLDIPGGKHTGIMHLSHLMSVGVIYNITPLSSTNYVDNVNEYKSYLKIFM